MSKTTYDDWWAGLDEASRPKWMQVGRDRRLTAEQVEELRAAGLNTTEWAIDGGDPGSVFPKGLLAFLQRKALA